ncbi:TPA: TetR/AcrR family transcriptional regulator, partial [Streptococcus suis]
LDEITQIVNTDLQFNDQVVLELLTYLKNNSNIVDAIRKVQPNIVFTINDYIKDLILHSEIVDFENTLVSKYNLPFKYALTLYVATIQSLITQWMDDDFEEELESVLKYISISIRI